MKHVHGHIGNLVMNVPIMPLHLVHLPSFPVTTLPHAGFVITLTLLPVVNVVSASTRFGKDCIALELKQRRCLRMGVNAVFIIGFFVSHTHCCVICGFALSPFSRASILLFRKSNGKPNFICLYRVSHRGYALVRHQPVDTLQDTHVGMCHRL